MQQESQASIELLPLTQPIEQEPLSPDLLLSHATEALALNNDEEGAPGSRVSGPDRVNLLRELRLRPDQMAQMIVQHYSADANTNAVDYESNAQMTYLRMSL